MKQKIKTRPPQST